MVCSLLYEYLKYPVLQFLLCQLSNLKYAGILQLGFVKLFFGLVPISLFLVQTSFSDSEVNP